MRSYEFAYFGRDLHALKDTIDTWCSPRQCILETTALLEGARECDRQPPVDDESAQHLGGVLAVHHVGR